MKTGAPLNVLGVSHHQRGEKYRTRASETGHRGLRILRDGRLTQMVQEELGKQKERDTARIKIVPICFTGGGEIACKSATAN